MVGLLSVTVVVALLVGYRANAKTFITATVGVLIVSLLMLSSSSGFAYAGKVAVNVIAFEVTTICAIVYFSAVRTRSLASRPEAQGPAGGNDR